MQLRAHCAVDPRLQRPCNIGVFQKEVERHKGSLRPRSVPKKNTSLVAKASTTANMIRLPRSLGRVHHCRSKDRTREIKVLHVAARGHDAVQGRLVSHVCECRKSVGGRRLLFAIRLFSKHPFALASSLCEWTERMERRKESGEGVVGRSSSDRCAVCWGACREFWSPSEAAVYGGCVGAVFVVWCLIVTSFSRWSRKTPGQGKNFASTTRKWWWWWVAVGGGGGGGGACVCACARVCVCVRACGCACGSGSGCGWGGVGLGVGWGGVCGVR